VELNRAYSGRFSAAPALSYEGACGKAKQSLCLMAEENIRKA
jgi:hypothetical protein